MMPTSNIKDSKEAIVKTDGDRRYSTGKVVNTYVATHVRSYVDGPIVLIVGHRF